MELVTGATGHIGNVLVRELVAQGRAVRALVLPKENTRSLAGLPIEIVEGNVLDMDSLRCAMQDVTCVYHLAGMITIMPGKNEQVRRVNVEGTRNIIQLMRELQIRRLVYTSSIHALKRVPEGILMDENLPFDPDILWPGSPSRTDMGFRHILGSPPDDPGNSQQRRVPGPDHLCPGPDPDLSPDSCSVPVGSDIRDLIVRFPIRDDIEEARKRRRRRTFSVLRGADDATDKDSALMGNRDRLRRDVLP